MTDLKHHIILHNYYSDLNDVLEKKIQKVRFSGISDVYEKYLIGNKTINKLERKLRLRKLEVEEEMEYHEENFAVKFDRNNKYVYKEFTKKEILGYMKLFKERVSSKIYNPNYKSKK